VILHIRYTTRLAGDPLGSQATTELIQMLDTKGQAGQALLFCLRYDFPTERSAFVNGTGDFQVTLDKQFFPLKPYEKFAEMIDAHWEGIAAYCKPENEVPLGFVEGLDNKIRAFQRRAYGLRDEEYLRLKVLSCMPPEI
jgi:hypothetical protein